AQDELFANFQNPPDSAKPRTWWHWTNGNVTEEGITKDLEWMKRAGIGGFQLVDVAAGSGQTVDKKINFGTPEWYHAVRHAAEEAARLGLEMSIFSSPGWSEAGGPWVKPEQGMKRLVWSETHVHGPMLVAEKLPKPPSNEGPVRDLRAGNANGPEFYRDSVVVAYRTPADEQPMQDLHPRATTDNGPIDAGALLDGSLNTSVNIAAPKDGGPAWLQYEFDTPYTARALTLGCHNRIPVGRVLVSDDGMKWKTIVVTPGPEGYHGAPVRTFAFPAETGRFFRIEFDGAGLLPAAVIHGGKPLPATQYTLTEAILYSASRVNRWEDKGAFGSLMDRYESVPTPSASSSAEIAQGGVIDITANLDADGTLHWNAPAGDWTVLRFGYALTGARNRPATAAGSGYEVDKLSADEVRSYFRGYMEPIREKLGPAAATLQYMTMDSWEAGMQNWTPAMISEFKKRRGYDPTPFMPVLAGRVVGSAETSDRFLWDFRRTLADLFASEYYGTMDQELHKDGMKAYAEASGVALEIPEDTLLNKSEVDIPMAEFWVHALHPESMYYVDVRGAASAAHAYGKPIVATESFTGGGYESPYTLKRVADYWFAQGVNRLVFHTSAQQPLDTKPGNTMVGTHINRNITWAEQARPFMNYIARISYLLQQGAPVADVAYLLPEGAPSTMPFWGSGLRPTPPEGFDYDYINTDLLLHHAHVANGNIVLDSGAQYRVLVLPPTLLMTPEVAYKLYELVQAGAAVAGSRPQHSPSLVHATQADEEVQALADDLWGDVDGVTKNEHHFGKGVVYAGLTMSDVMQRLHVSPDFASSGSLGAAPVWVHRKLADRDLYYVSNQADSPVKLDIRVRANGRSAEIWRPMTGERSLADAAFADGTVTLSIALAERETVFIVISNTASSLKPAAPPTEKQLIVFHGPWSVSFNGPGAPASTTLLAAHSWTESGNPALKYFSGTATYTRSFSVSPSWLHTGMHLVLDLGRVGDIAEVRLNGSPAGTIWAPPYRVDVTAMLKPGLNRLEIAVTNEFTNRILGDRLLPEDKRVLGTAADVRMMFGGPQAPLPSGLLGDVTLTAFQQ
ncbi:MAG TPA: glycosyl hydrolase, partial [Terracidiphilus sp.]|nr:glycosyl hydrolase [Terracidiphilus sp.]